MFREPQLYLKHDLVNNLHLGFRSMDIFADLDLEPTDRDPEHEHWQQNLDLTLKPDLTATLKAPKTAAAPPQSCFIPGIAVLDWEKNISYDSKKFTECIKIYLDGKTTGIVNDSLSDPSYSSLRNQSVNKNNNNTTHLNPKP